MSRKSILESVHDMYVVIHVVVPLGAALAVALTAFKFKTLPEDFLEALSWSPESGFQVLFYVSIFWVIALGLIVLLLYLDKRRRSQATFLYSLAADSIKDEARARLPADARLQGIAGYFVMERGRLGSGSGAVYYFYLDANNEQQHHRLGMWTRLTLGLTADDGYLVEYSLQFDGTPQTEVGGLLTMHRRVPRSPNENGGIAYVGTFHDEGDRATRFAGSLYAERYPTRGGSDADKQLQEHARRLIDSSQSTQTRRPATEHAGRSHAGRSILYFLAVVFVGVGVFKSHRTEGQSGPVDPKTKTKLIIESWRSDDLAAWKEHIIPAFEREHPTIEVDFRPIPFANYDPQIKSKLGGGTAGDLITCRPFDGSLMPLFSPGYLDRLDDLPGLEHFSSEALRAWQTENHSTTYCVPIAHVTHGFIYNKDIFKALRLEAPRTVKDFFDTLEKIKKDGRYVGLDIGIADQWEAGQLGFENIGPTYWKGEEGRNRLLEGSARFIDAPYEDAFKQLAKWRRYLSKGYESQKYSDSQQLFIQGRAAIYPAGSWDAGVFRERVKFPFGAFKPPLVNANDPCYVTDHLDMGMGLNKKSAHKHEARVFLEWLTTKDFAQLYANNVLGFFPLSDYAVDVSDPVVVAFRNWSQECNRTIRVEFEKLSRGTPTLEDEIWDVSASVLRGTLNPSEASQRLEANLQRWYKPHQGTPAGSAGASP